jgi:hypothetical protein
MSLHYDDPDYSSIEDLDPEPQSYKGRTGKREFMLGILLLLAVLGWGGWNWWQQESKQNSYHAAQQAVLARDWDSAREHFAAASGYKDSNSQVAQIDKLITDRDKWYKLALGDKANKEWVASLKDARSVSDIQPHYRDTEQLQKEAESQLYKDAVQGAVALRTHGEPPGLYFRGEAGWQWLDKSDQWSKLEGSGPGGHVVYDIPGAGSAPGHDPTSTPEPGALIGGTQDLQGRRLAVASFQGDKVTTNTLGFDPGQYNIYFCGERGAWAIRFGDSSSSEDDLMRLLSSFVFGEIAYQPAGSPEISTLALPGPKWAVADLAPDGAHVLLVDLTSIHDARPMSYLYIANGDGSNRRLLYSYKGGFSAAQFSPDSAWVAATTYDIMSPSPEHRDSTVLLDAKGATPPRLLAAGISISDLGAGQPAVGAAFLRDGPYAGKLLLGEWAASGVTLSLLDPAHPGAPLMKGTIGGIATQSATFDSTSRQVCAGYQSGGKLVVGWQNGNPFQNGVTNTMTVLSISPGSSPSVTSLQMDERTLLYGGSVRQDRLVYGQLVWPAGSGDSAGFTLRSLPLPGPAGKQATAVTVFSDTIQAFAGYGSVSRWKLGFQVAAGTIGDTLHAATYGGDADVTLEQGVSKLYDLDQSTQLYWLR